MTAEPSAGFSMLPVVGRSSPAIRLRSVDLPQPEAPSRQTNSPGAMSRVMSSSTTRPVAEPLADALHPHGRLARRHGVAHRHDAVEARTEQVGRAAARRRVDRHRAGGLASGRAHGYSSPSPAAETDSAPAAASRPLSRTQIEQPVDRALLLRACLEPVLDERLERVGVRVERERDVLERPRDDLVGERLAGLGLEGRVDHARRLLGVVGDPLDGRDVALQQLLDDVRVLVEEVGAHEQHGCRELAVLPQVGFVHEDVRARIDDQSRHPRLRQPRAVQLALLEQRERLRVLGRSDVHVTASRGVGLEALVRRASCGGRHPACCRAGAWRGSCPRGRPGLRSRRGRRAPRRRSRRRR